MSKSTAIEKQSDEPKTVLAKWAEELNDDKPIFKKGCKLCGSPYREDAEMEYEKQGGNINAVLKFLQSKGMGITYNAVERHITGHYLVQEQNARQKEYAEGVQDIMKCRRERKTQLRERIAMLEKQLYSLSMSLENTDVEIKIKGAPAVKQLHDTILSHENEIAEIDKAAEPVTLMINNLQSIIMEEMKKTKSEEVKNTLLNLFDKLSNSVSGVLVDKK